MTNEEVKRWLMRGWNIRRRIGSLEATKENAWDAATRTNASAGSARGGTGVSRKPERFIETSSAVDEAYKRLDSVLAEITRVIDHVEDNTLATLLQERYVNMRTWEEVADRVGYDYVHTVHRLHPKALLAAKDAIECNYPPVVKR